MYVSLTHILLPSSVDCHNNWIFLDICEQLCTMDVPKKKRKGKIAPSVEENSSFELDMRSEIHNNR